MDNRTLVPEHFHKIFPNIMTSSFRSEISSLLTEYNHDLSKVPLCTYVYLFEVCYRSESYTGNIKDI